MGSCGQDSVHCVPMLDRSTPNSTGAGEVGRVSGTAVVTTPLIIKTVSAHEAATAVVRRARGLMGGTRFVGSNHWTPKNWLGWQPRALPGQLESGGRSCGATKLGLRANVDRGTASVLWRPRRADDEAYVVGPKRRGVPRVRAAAIALRYRPCHSSGECISLGSLPSGTNLLSRPSPAAGRMSRQTNSEQRRRTAAHAEQSSVVARSRPDCFLIQRRRMSSRRGRGERSKLGAALVLLSAAQCDRRDDSRAVLVTDIISGTAGRGRLQRDFRSRRQRP